MQMSLIAPELRAPMRKVPPISPRGPIGRWLMRRMLGLMPAAALGDVTLEQVEAEGVPLRIYRPADLRSAGALLWIHGGGYVIGRAAQDDHLCARLACELGIVVASVDYRLAPEHPFPAPLDDCHAGWRWLRDAAALQSIDPARIAIGGQSAGGGLAAGLVQRLRDEGEHPAAQLLFCPMLDDRTAARRELDAIRHRVWSNRDNRAGWHAYLGRTPGEDDMPDYAAPARREHLGGLPPAWIGVGSIDLFHAEDRAYAGRLRESGVDATFHAVDGAPHGFEAWAPDTAISRAYLAAAANWLGRQLAR